MAAPSDGRSAAGTPKRHAVVSPAGSQSLSLATGLPSAGVWTWIDPMYWPLASKFANSGARWFIVVWQLAHTTDLVSWKSTVPPLVGAAMELNGHGEV